MQNQIEKNKQRLASLVNQIIAAPKEKKKELQAKADYWTNQVRMAEAAQISKQNYKPLFN